MGGHACSCLDMAVYTFPKKPQTPLQAHTLSGLCYQVGVQKFQLQQTFHHTLTERHQRTYMYTYAPARSGQEDDKQNV